MSKMTYAQAFAIAKTTRRCSDKLFRDGVERAAALAVVGKADPSEIADVMTEEFCRHEDFAPRWNGSIA